MNHYFRVPVSRFLGVVTNPRRVGMCRMNSSATLWLALMSVALVMVAGDRCTGQDGLVCSGRGSCEVDTGRNSTRCNCSPHISFEPGTYVSQIASITNFLSGPDGSSSLGVGWPTCALPAGMAAPDLYRASLCIQVLRLRSPLLTQCPGCHVWARGICMRDPVAALGHSSRQPQSQLGYASDAPPSSSHSPLAPALPLPPQATWP